MMGVDQAINILEEFKRTNQCKDIDVIEAIETMINHIQNLYTINH